MLTDDGRRTMHDDGRQPMTIGHLSDSGDLKMENIPSYGFSKWHTSYYASSENMKFMNLPVPEWIGKQGLLQT